MGVSGLARSVKIEGRDATVDGMYLRIIVPANERKGQSDRLHQSERQYTTLVERPTYS
jgi:hypothetical protein